MQKDDQQTSQPEQPVIQQQTPRPNQPLPPQQQSVNHVVENPGQTLGILSIVLPFVGFSLVGIVLGAISRHKSKQAGMSASLGTVGLIISIVFTVLTVLVTTLWIVLMVVAIGSYDGSESQIAPVMPEDSWIQPESTGEPESTTGDNFEQ